MPLKAKALECLKIISQDSEYMSIVSDIIFNPEFQKLTNFTHHNNFTRLEHSLNVSYLSYKMCKKLSLDAISAARGGLLHDFFLYDWRTAQLPEGSKAHAIEHPRQALATARKHFEVNEIEADIIARHMWPVTITPPKYLESYIIVFYDKFTAVFELMNKSIMTERRLSHIPLTEAQAVAHTINLNKVKTMFTKIGKTNIA